MNKLFQFLSPIGIAIAAISCVANSSSGNAKNIMMEAPTEQKAGSFAPIAVIELFTSQGCSSCPPADELLTKTILADKSLHVYALSFHVDYWDRLGWKDPFSDKRFSQRQYDYVNKLQLNSAYTPQMVVNGQREFVGSNANSLQAALSQALKTSTTAQFSNITASKQNGNWLIKYNLEGDISNKQINVALVSEQEITKIKRGENAGRTLQSNNVVRTFVTETPMANGLVKIEQPEIIGTETKQAIVIYLQDTRTLKVSGAAKLSL